MIAYDRSFEVKQLSVPADKAGELKRFTASFARMKRCRSPET